MATVAVVLRLEGTVRTVFNVSPTPPIWEVEQPQCVRWAVAAPGVSPILSMTRTQTFNTFCVDLAYEVNLNQVPTSPFRYSLSHTRLINCAAISDGAIDDREETRMSMGKRKRRQESLFITADNLPRC